MALMAESQLMAESRMMAALSGPVPQRFWALLPLPEGGANLKLEEFLRMSVPAGMPQTRMF